jgi:hypothetical protein
VTLPDFSQMYLLLHLDEHRSLAEISNFQCRLLEVERRFPRYKTLFRCYRQLYMALWQRLRWKRRFRIMQQYRDRQRKPESLIDRFIVRAWYRRISRATR